MPSPAPRLPRATLLLLAAAALGACGDDSPPGDPDAGRIEPTYANVAGLIDRACDFSGSCHGGTGNGQARLNFDDARDDFTTVLSGVTSCEYDAMPRVDPGNPDNSWLMIKIDGMVDADNNLLFEPDPGWMPDTSDPLCPGDGDFGVIMPQSTDGLTRAERELFREWIAMGAPGPS